MINIFSFQPVDQTYSQLIMTAKEIRTESQRIQAKAAQIHDAYDSRSQRISKKLADIDRKMNELLVEIRAEYSK